MRWPDMLVLGAAKCGTTSLHQYLSEHPGIYMSRVKEPGYFAFSGDQLEYKGPGDEWMKRSVTTSPDVYCGLFKDASSDQLTGESSPAYLHSREAPSRIREQVPDVRMIVILRNPIDRAFSHYRFMVACGREPLGSFFGALKAEDQRIADGWEWGWSYRGLGYYHEQLTRYFKYFDRDQIHVVLFEDLEENALKVLEEIYRFLNVDPSFEPDTTKRLNVTKVSRQRRVSQVLRSTGLRRVVHAFTTENQRRQVAGTRLLGREILKREAIDEAAVAFLKSAYETDLSALQDLLHRDLTDWVNPQTP